VLDCVDEAASILNYYPNTNRYSVIMKAVMRPEAVGSAHVLRLRYYLGHVLIDDAFWDMVHAHKVTGIAFKRLDGSNRRVVRTEFSPREEECEEDEEDEID
jgi:hypothetical protein